MSLALPSPALASAGPRRRGVTIILVCVGGFLVGEVLALMVGTIAVKLSGSSLTFTQIFKLSEPPWWFILSILIGGWMGWALAIWGLQRRFAIIRLPAALRFRPVDLLGIPMAVVLQGAIGLAYRPFHPKGIDQPTHHLFGDASGVTFALLAMVTVFVVPIFEETFFRGALLPGTRDLTQTKSAAISAVLAISADGVLFGVAHGEILQLPALAAIGMILAFLYWHTGRLWPCYITHASFNAVAVIGFELSRMHH